LGVVVKIAILADIHGNLPALQAVLNDMPAVNSLICCGDVVGYYPDVNEVCSQMRTINAFVIRGNHDAYVVGGLNPEPTKRSFYRIDWTHSRLSDSHRHWLSGLPIELSFSWGNLSVTVRHASPWDEETYLYPDSPDLAKISLEKDEILILGHTHHPMLVKVGEGILINPGSVGQPRDWNPQASYAILQTESKSIEHKRVAYNVAELQRRLKSLSWEESAINILSRQAMANR
jgi:putative phosphoesterase